MDSFFRSFDYSSGTITYIEEKFSAHKSMQQLDDEFMLREDLLQVEYPKELLLDVGWYGSYSQDGSEWGMFKVRIIRGIDWEKPLYTGRTKDIASLAKQIETALKKIERLLKTD